MEFISPPASFFPSDTLLLATLTFSAYRFSSLGSGSHLSDPQFHPYRPELPFNYLTGAKLHSLIIVAEDSTAVFVFQHSRRRVSPPFLNTREVAKDRAIRLAHNDR